MPPRSDGHHHGMRGVGVNPPALYRSGAEMAIAAVALASRMPENEDFPRATVAPANYEENSQTDVIMKRNPGRIARESRCRSICTRSLHG
jgi:hypothetical protein